MCLYLDSGTCAFERGSKVHVAGDISLAIESRKETGFPKGREVSLLVHVPHHTHLLCACGVQH